MVDKGLFISERLDWPEKLEAKEEQSERNNIGLQWVRKKK